MFLSPFSVSLGMLLGELSFPRVVFVSSVVSLGMYCVLQVFPCMFVSLGCLQVFFFVSLGVPGMFL